MNFKRSNTEIEKLSDGSVNFYLHGNTIATLNTTEKKLYVYHAGWKTNTTKERLNGILHFLDLWTIFQKNFEWYFINKKNEIQSFNSVLEFTL